MKTIVLAFLIAANVALADSSNVTVRISGRLQNASEIEQAVVAHARRAQMQFNFSGTRPYFTVLSNSPAVISMWCAHTNGSYFYGTVDAKGRVKAQELTLTDAEAIRAMLAQKTTNEVTRVWLGPDGLVGAMTIQTGEAEGEIFELRRVRASWAIHNRGKWKVTPPAIRVPDIHAG